MIDISKQEIESDCPSCNSKFSITLQQVSNQETIRCRSCGENIRLIDKGGSARKGIRDVNKSFNDLEKAFKNFGKRLR